MDELNDLVIVDDERIIREGLRDMVDWRALGFRVAACFEDGREALEFIESNRVQAILTDIRMADVSGIDIARHISEKMPDVRVVILSGYRDFEYARGALRYHAWRYLLKPVDFGELETVFRELNREIGGGASGGREGALVPVVRRQFYSDLVSERFVSTAQLRYRSAELGLRVDFDRCTCALIVVRIGPTADGRGIDSISGVVRAGVLNSMVSQTRSFTLDEIMAFAGRVVAIGVSIEASDEETFRRRVAIEMKRVAAMLCEAFQVAIDVRTVASFGSLSGLLSSHPARLIEQALQERTPYRPAPGDESSDPTLRRVQEYLRENCSSDISLADAADRAFLSPVYFSKYFKEHTGISFTRYLAQLRVEKAIALFRENRHKVHEVGRLVGYRSPRYFSRVFKRMTGYSPREYCRRVLAMER